MASDSDDSLDLEIDDLEGLQAELEELRAALGDSYVEYQGGDAEDEDLPPLPPLPPLRGAALAGVSGRSGQADLQGEDDEEEDGDVEDDGGSSSGEETGMEIGESEGEEEEEPWPPAVESEPEEDEGQAAARLVAASFAPLPVRIANAQAAVARREAREARQAAAAPLPGKPAKKPARGYKAAAKVTESKQRASRGGKEKQPAAKDGKQPPGKQQQKQQQQAKGRQAKQGQAKGKQQPRKGRKSKAALAAEAAAAAAAEAEAEAAAEAANVPPMSKAQAVREALEANRQLQNRLRRLLASTDRAIERNATVLLQVRDLHARKNAPPAVSTIPSSRDPSAATQAPVGSSWFWGAQRAVRGGAGGQALPLNPDADTLKPVLKYLPFSFRTGKWSEEEQQRLRDGVLQMVQECQLGDVMREMQQRLEGGGAVSLADYEVSRQRISGLTFASPAVAQIAGGFVEGDWAKLVQRTRLQRSTAECRLQWTNCLSPALSQQPWSAEEDGHLRQLVEKHKQRRWEAVSRELGVATGGALRPPLSCLQRHLHLTAAAAKERQFDTEAGVGRLAELVAKHGASWKRIAEEFGGEWSSDQLMHIWRRHAQRGMGARRGKWTREEDDALLKAMALHGRKWSYVAKLVPGRTDVQCRERYMNVLNPDVKTWHPWTEEHDGKLLELVAQHTQEDGRVKWSAVAAQLPGRTDKQCAIRWKALVSGESASKEPGDSDGGRSTKKKKKKQSKSKKSKQEEGLGGEGGEEAGADGAPAGKRQRSESADPTPAASTGTGTGQAGEEREQGGVQAAAAGSTQQQEAQAGGSAAARRPQRQRRQRRWNSDGEEVEEEPTSEEAAAAAAAAAAVAAAKQAAPLVSPQLPTAPPATSHVMPCTRPEARGRRVSIWWMEEGAGGAGHMYGGVVTAWSKAAGQHSVRYDGEKKAVQCRLEDETVEWLEVDNSEDGEGEDGEGAKDGDGEGAGGEGAGEGAAGGGRSAARCGALVTGPGTPWPEDAEAAAKATQAAEGEAAAAAAEGEAAAAGEAAEPVGTGGAAQRAAADVVASAPAAVAEARAQTVGKRKRKHGTAEQEQLAQQVQQQEDRLPQEHQSGEESGQPQARPGREQEAQPAAPAGHEGGAQQAALSPLAAEQPQGRRPGRQRRPSARAAAAASEDPP